jgi:hypothetical protein
MLAVLSLLLAIPRIASADLIGVTWGGFDATGSLVVRIDSTTGDAISATPSGAFGLNSLAGDSSGTLYSHTSFDNRLYTIDPGTGVATPGAALSTLLDIRSLAFSPDGTLYAIDKPGDIDSINGLYTINVATGVVTFIGPTGKPGLQGLDFSPEGTLYGFDFSSGLATLNTTTGLATTVNPALGFPGVDIQSLVFGPDGVLYGGRESLYTIDRTTSLSTFVGTNNYDIRGLESAAVPEPASLWLVVSGAAALWMRRRRKGRFSIC